ncbi:MAG: heme exporter protein C [Halieaceae bacterium]
MGTIICPHFLSWRLVLRLTAEYNLLTMWSFFHKLGSPPWLFVISGHILRWLLPVAVLGLAVGLTWGLLYTAPDFRQGNSYRIIYIHVPAAVVALAGYYVMAIAGAVSLIWKMKMADIAMLAVAPVGAALSFIALVTGSIWGKPTWGTWWVWDARITSMLILLFLYLGVMALYEAYDNKAAAARACAVLSLVGTVNIPIIYKSVDWWYSLHQPASIKFTGESTIDPSMLYPLLLCILSVYALFSCALLANMRVGILQRERRTGWVQRLADTGA